MKLAKPYFTKKKVQSRLAIMEVMKDTSKEILYQELGLESIQRSRCYRKTCSFYSMFMNNKCHIFQTLFPRHYLSKEPATKIIYHFLVHNITFHRKHFLYLLSLNGTNQILYCKKTSDYFDLKKNKEKAKQNKKSYYEFSKTKSEQGS